VVNGLAGRRRDGQTDDRLALVIQVVDMLDAATRSTPAALPFTTALITGASRGLGRALARTLALDHRLQVVLVARGQLALDEAVAEIRAAGGVAHGIVADIADKHAIHRIAGEAAALVGDIDILIHAASTLGPTPLRLLLDSECEDFSAVLETNVVGPFRLTKALLGSMVVRDSGVIVDVSSDAAVEAYPSWGLYGVSKAALDHLTRIWAAELEGTNVRMLAVDPGEMDTQMHADAIPDADPATLARPETVARIIVAMIGDPTRARSGMRLSAGSWIGSSSEAEVPV
jgi:NAD(P)-dependent dehydrogenase (short-subunit alcohol dehydrogenase family)